MVSVTAKDQYGNTATGYSGAVRIAASDPGGSVQLPQTLTNGTALFSAALRTAGSQLVIATDTAGYGFTGTSNAITVIPDAATRLAVSASASATAGTTLAITVTALDQFGNTATGYTGTAHFSSTDAAAALPLDSTLAGGQGLFSVTLKKAGPVTVTAADTVSSSMVGSATISVNAAAAKQFKVSGSPTTINAGLPLVFTVVAQDQFANTVANYAGTVQFSTTDSQANFTPTATLSAGVGLLAVTFRTAGSQTLTATDSIYGAVTGTSNTITVNALAVQRFVVSGPGSIVAGSPFVVTVAAKDSFNNTVTGYKGTVHFTSTDGAPFSQTMSPSAGALARSVSSSRPRASRPSRPPTPPMTASPAPALLSPSRAAR